MFVSGFLVQMCVMKAGAPMCESDCLLRAYVVEVEAAAGYSSRLDQGQIDLRDMIHS